MARQLTPAELEGLLGAYALGAVDDDERAQVEAYVADHPTAAEELEHLQDAAVWLAVRRALWKRSRPPKPEPAPRRAPSP
jgi:anti-sigma factor RsiW